MPAHPFTAPEVSAETIIRCSATNTASAGRIATRHAAARSCVVAALVAPAKVKIPTDIGQSDASEMQMKREVQEL